MNSLYNCGMIFVLVALFKIDTNSGPAWEEGISTGELLPSRWLVGRTVRHFSCLLIVVVSLSLLWAAIPRWWAWIL